MIRGMWRRVGRGLGRVVLGLAWACAQVVGGLIAACAVLGAALTAAADGFERGTVSVFCGLVLAIVVHELGHLLAARLAGAQVAAIDIGGPPALVTFRLGGIRLGLGWRPRGLVRLTRPLAAGRTALVVLAGPLASLLMAVVLLAVPAPVWLSWPVALLSAGVGLVSLVPQRSRAGRSSDGAVLAGLPGQLRAEADLRRLMALPGWQGRADAADRLLAADRRNAAGVLGRPDVIAESLREHGRIDDLLALHAREFPLSDAPSPGAVMVIHRTEWVVLTVAGLPRLSADLAAWRLDWVLRHSAAETLPAARHSVALARLRQQRFAEVEPLCTDALAADLTPGERATVLATVAMARHALGHDCRALLAEALALDPAAELVSEAGRLAPDLAPPVTTASPLT